MIARRLTTRGRALLVAVVAASMLAVPAATGAQDESAGASPAAAESPAGSPAAQPSVASNPYPEQGAIPGSGQGRKIGYISLGDSLPFVKLVSDSIAEQAGVAGAELVFCDSQVLAEKALECGQNLGVQAVEAVLNFNLHGDSSPEICEAYGNVPTLAIDIHQPPCEVTFFGANNLHAGELGGIAFGEALQAENGCQYDQIVTLESAAAGIVNEDRVAGMLNGLASVCGPIDEAKLRREEVGGTTELAIQKVNDVLPTIAPGSTIVILSLNDDMAIGAQTAARQAGREAELRIGAQGADQSAWQLVACDPTWLSDVSYSPELYGRTVVPAIIDILDGKPVADTLYTPNTAITKDNIREVYPDTPAC